jgi:hypothetical protein
MAWHYYQGIAWMFVHSILYHRSEHWLMNKERERGFEVKSISWERWSNWQVFNEL